MYHSRVFFILIPAPGVSLNGCHQNVLVPSQPQESPGMRKLQKVSKEAEEISSHLVFRFIESGHKLAVSSEKYHIGLDHMTFELLSL